MKHLAIWALALLMALFFCLTNLPWQLDEFSQDRQALASYDIVKEGCWLYQHAPRDREATKPPLIPWISAGLYAVTRSWDVAWRLPSLAAALTLAWLLFATARRRFGRTAALLGVAAFGFNMLSPRLATLVRTDMPLALVVFIIGCQIWEKIETRKPWTRRERWLLFSLLTIGVFIKGPVIYVFLLPGVALFEWHQRKEGTMGYAWSGWWPWLGSLGIFAVWVIGGLATQPGFFDQVIMHEFLGRFQTMDQRPHPPYYYVGHLLHKFAPWSELLIILPVWSSRSGRPSTGRWRLRTALASVSPEIFWLLCWSLSGLIIMSVIPSKRLDRIFPIIPPLCLLIAAQLNPAAAKESARVPVQRWIGIGLIASLILTSYYCVSRVFQGYRDHWDALAVFGREVRRQASTRRWRYEVVASHGGSILLYLDKSHFADPDRAVAEWNGGELDALAVGGMDAPALVPRLFGPTSVSLRSGTPRDAPGKDYILIIREPSGN